MRLDPRQWIRDTLNQSLTWITDVQNIDCYTFFDTKDGAKLFNEVENTYIQRTGTTLSKVSSLSVEASNILFEELQNEVGMLEGCCRL